MFDTILQSNQNDEDIEFLPLVSINEDFEKKGEDLPTTVPIIPLKNTILFPGVVVPVNVGRDKSIAAIKKASKKGSFVGIVAQKDENIEEPEVEDLFKIGILAKILKVLKMPDGNSTVILQGRKKMMVDKFTKSEPNFEAKITLFEEDENFEKIDSSEHDALISSIRDLAMTVVDMSPNIPDEAGIALKNMDRPSFLTHFIASNLNISIREKQELLEINNFTERAEKILYYLNEEVKLLELKREIHKKVHTEIDKQQRDYFLHQQIKTIREELGDGNNSLDEVEELKKRASKKKWSKTVNDTFYKELAKLQRMNPMVGEYSMTLNYLEFLLDLPWGEFSDDHFDLNKASKILDKDHHGLEKVKDRILEYLAVLKLKGDLKSPILCLVGPPGVGKTSLGRSIANAVGRKYVRMSLGGLHDESEIRGHRKTYIGALPGRVIQNIKKVGTSNPVFILDEIDKVGNDFRGDPSSALLEVLDPEQNHSFYDNYLEMEYDLSNVMFIATANNLASIQPALRDRMEIIDVSGYSVEEKVSIAKKHLIPQQRKNHGLKATHLKLSDSVIETVISEYTRESGVRNLDRKIAAIMRRVAKNVAMETEYKKAISKEVVREILGVDNIEKEIFPMKNELGIAIGLAWTAVGGDILYIETNKSKGKGNLTLTGNLGDVMKESATSALSYLKSKSKNFDIDPSVFEQNNFHIHFPEGGIPKDGPSAGITILTALYSTIKNKRVRPNLAMTGEITLRGKVLPVGGIKEKILAANRSGAKEIILCQSNRKNVEEINPDYIKGLQFHYVDKMEEVLEIAF